MYPSLHLSIYLSTYFALCQFCSKLYFFISQFPQPLQIYSDFFPLFTIIIYVSFFFTTITMGLKSSSYSNIETGVYRSCLYKTVQLMQFIKEYCELNEPERRGLDVVVGPRMSDVHLSGRRRSWNDQDPGRGSSTSGSHQTGLNKESE